MCLIASIVNRAQAKVERETESARVKILGAQDLQSASRAMYDAMKNCPGHSAKSALITCFQSRIQEEDVVNRYAAFEEMYRLYQKSGDTVAMNIAHMLGEGAAAEAVAPEKPVHKAR